MDIPIFPLELVLVPGEPLPLHIYEPRYQEMVARCVDGDEPFTLVLSDDDGMRDVGCTAEITEVLEKFPDGRSNIVVTGRDVVRVDEVHDAHNYRSAVVSPIDDDPDEATADAQQAAITAYTAVSAELPGQAPSAPEPGPRLSYALVARVDLGLDVKQSLLENRDEQRRLEVVTELLVDIHRGLVLTRETQERARKNGRVRTPEELAVELGLDE
jgi:Lon protease-like protein